MARTKVLLIDDEIEFVEALSERLCNRGFKVETATNGPDGISKSESTNFDAVVLDIVMPGMDGIIVLKRLRQAQPDIQVLLLSGQATIKAAVEAARMGAVDILEKPLDIETLVEKIQLASERHSRAEEQRAQGEAEKVAAKNSW